MASLLSLITEETKEVIYQKALDLAATLGLPVTSWQPGDPTRSLYHILATKLATLDSVVSSYVQSGFLDYASEDWLTILAEQVYGVERVEATYATSTVVLTNSGGGVYPVSAGEIVLRDSLTGKTYHNTNAGTIAASSTFSVDAVADEAGSDSNAGVNEIDELVTTFLGVVVTSSTAAIGLDEESDSSLKDRCRASLGKLSPNGPALAYDAVATDPDLTGTVNVTKTQVIEDAVNGSVQVYVAGSSGTVGSGDVTLVTNAILEYATPICIQPTVTAASEVQVDIVYTLKCYSTVNLTSGQIESAVDDALETMFAELAIGGDEGELTRAKIQSTIFNAVTSVYEVTVSLPVANVALADGEVATKGTITVSPAITITQV
jgi:hypothetical protein